ncbi:MAG: family 1 encapsulin nanocompartment shell protein [Thermosphaera sp.]
MLSKHPLELPISRTLTKDEVLDALRLAIIAELDAISLYLQIARSVTDDNVRKVFEDIAREEKTHVGEFLALLKHFDTEQSMELEKGSREVTELTGIPGNSQLEVRESSESSSPSTFNEELIRRFTGELNASRIVALKSPRVVVGRGVESVPYPMVREGGGEERGIAVLQEISVRFKIPQKALDYYEKTRVFDAPELYLAARQLAVAQDKLIVESLISNKFVVRMKMSSWETPGASVVEVASAVGELLKSGLRGPLMLLVHPSKYVKLLNVSDKTGVMDLERVKSIVNEIVVSDAVPENKALLVAADASVFDVVVGGDGVVDYIGPEDGFHVFRAWSTMAVRVKDPRGIVVLSEAE